MPDSPLSKPPPLIGRVEELEQIAQATRQGRHRCRDRGRCPASAGRASRARPWPQPRHGAARGEWVQATRSAAIIPLGAFADFASRRRAAGARRWPSDRRGRRRRAAARPRVRRASCCTWPPRASPSWSSPCPTGLPGPPRSRPSGTTSACSACRSPRSIRTRPASWPRPGWMGRSRSPRSTGPTSTAAATRATCSSSCAARSSTMRSRARAASGASQHAPRPSRDLTELVLAQLAEHRRGRAARARAARARRAVAAAGGGRRCSARRRSRPSRQQGLVTTTLGYRVAHPLHAEVLRAELPSSRARARAPAARGARRRARSVHARTMRCASRAGSTRRARRCRWRC